MLKSDSTVQPSKLGAGTTRYFSKKFQTPDVVILHVGLIRMGPPLNPVRGPEELPPDYRLAAPTRAEPRGVARGFAAPQRGPAAPMEEETAEALDLCQLDAFCASVFQHFWPPRLNDKQRLMRDSSVETIAFEESQVPSSAQAWPCCSQATPVAPLTPASTAPTESPGAQMGTNNCRMTSCPRAPTTSPEGGWGGFGGSNQLLRIWLEP